jgi:adenosylcobinamide-GDP ribazoletransferase
MKPQARALEFLAALSFLTVLPIAPKRLPTTGRDSLWAFPLIGMLVGLLGGILVWGASYLGLSPLLGAILAVAAQVLITGGLHEDGLGDVADGLGGRTKEERFEIMRDSRIGTFGVLALTLTILLRIGLIAWLDGALAVVPALMVSGALSRAALPALMYNSKPARDDGLGHGFGAPDAARCWVAVLIGAIIALLLLPLLPATAAILVVTLMAALLRGWTLRWIGGYTGDTLGAAQQLLEISVLLLLVLSLAAD